MFTIKTNHVPRDVIDGWSLTPKEREEFKYVDWDAIREGNDSASFFRYRGSLYDLGEFSSTWGISRESGMPGSLAGWDGYITESAFSGIAIKYVDGFEGVIVAYFYS